MADEPKAPPPGGPSEPPAKPSEGAGGETSPAKPVVAGKPTEAGKAATPAAKPPAPSAAKAPVKPEPWSGPLLEELQKRFPGSITDPLIFRNQPSITVAKESLSAVGTFLKSDEGGGYTLLTDETAVDYPKREKRFEVIYHLYSFKRNDRLRMKVLAGEGEKIPSVFGLWPTADWLEREVYDMFGVVYEGHPNLKRILLPDEWVGHPLRKDYDILRQDDAWVQANLNIKSGQ
jgi:NADH-quinone oxidoreductase subunit C